MIPFYYGGIDRIYGNISLKSADKILNIIDTYCEIKETLNEASTKKGSYIMDLSKIKRLEKFRKFIFPESPVIFKNYFKDKNFDVVRIYKASEIDTCSHNVYGSFSWFNNEFKPLKGKSYSSDVQIYGYYEFNFEDHEELLIGLDIIVD